jgi:hypothetical protein
MNTNPLNSTTTTENRPKCLNCKHFNLDTIPGKGVKGLCYNPESGFINPSSADVCLLHDRKGASTINHLKSKIKVPYDRGDYPDNMTQLELF